METLDDFLEWVEDKVTNIVGTIMDVLSKIPELLLNTLAWILVVILAIISAPIWIPLLIYWLVFVRNKKSDEEN